LHRSGGAPATTAAPSQAWASTRDALIEEYLKAQPAFAVYQGRHEFDGQLPDWSAEGIAAETKRLHAARDRAAAVSGLSPAETFERDYLVSQFDDDLFWLEDVQQPFTNPAFYIGALDPSPYLTRTYAPIEQRMRALHHLRPHHPARDLTDPRQSADAAREAACRARHLRIRRLRRFLQEPDVAKAFTEVKDAALQKSWRTSTPRLRRRCPISPPG
jgi:hypothetical protein